jgi:predicted NBD/HSP70 family sugar kinase
VLEAIVSGAPTTRAAIAARTGLSRPTVSALVDALEAEGVVRRAGRRRGGVGRSAVLFAPNPRAGHVIGVDIGGSRLRGALADLSGGVLAEREEAGESAGARALALRIDRLCRTLTASAGLDGRDVAQVVVSRPGVEEARGTTSLAPNVSGLDEVPVDALVSEMLGTPVASENDVNLAAVGEQAWGVARSAADFVFLSLGVGVGAGIVVGGELVRGSRGAAGEVGYLPLGAEDPSDAGVRRRGAFESSTAADAISALASGRPPLAALSDASALAEAARRVAGGVLAIAAVIDPELVVLGGEVGAAPALAPAVQRALEPIAPFAVRVEASALGARASLLGAVAAALRLARPRVLGVGAASLSSTRRPAS